MPHGVDHYITAGPDEALELFYLFTPATPPFPQRPPENYPVVAFSLA